MIYKIKYLKSSLNSYEPPIQVERTKQWKSPTESIAGWYIVMYPSYLRQSISWTLDNNYGTHTIYTLINLTHILTLQLHIIYLYTKLSIVIYLYIELSICILIFFIYLFFWILLFIIRVFVLSLSFCCTVELLSQKLIPRMCKHTWL